VAHRLLNRRHSGRLPEDLADGRLHLAAAAEDADRQGDEERRHADSTRAVRRARARARLSALAPGSPARSSRSSSISSIADLPVWSWRVLCERRLRFSASPISE
jgi:hypothetical protein